MTHPGHPDRRGPTVPLTLAGLLLAGAAGAQLLRYHEAPDDPPAAIVARDDAAARSPAARAALGGYVSVQVNVDENGMNIVGDAANEPSITVYPFDRRRMVIGWRQFDSIGSNFREAGWALTDDEGASWTFPGVLEEGVFRTDPVLDADSEGRLFYNSLSGADLLDMDVWRSLDGGQGWLSPVPAFGGDKNWMVVDSTGGIGDGNVYGTWQRPIGCCGPDVFTRSVDGALSFESPVPVTNSPSFGVLAVGPDGEVYAAGIDGDSGQDFNTLVVSRSDDARDAGASPTFTGREVDLGGSLVFGGGPNPAGLQGQVWVATDRSDGPSRGHAYLLASVNPPGGDPLDVRIARTIDGGQSWEPSVRVNDDAGTSAYQWFGTISVAPNRRIDVVWNDTRNSGMTFVSQLFYTWSYDGGKTWWPSAPVSPAFDSSLGWPNQDKLGDYYDMISDDLGADLAWAATFNGEQDVYYLRLFPDCNANDVSDVTDVLSGTSDDEDGNDIPDECQGLTLGNPEPGLPGQVNTFEVRGATPGATVVVVADVAAGGVAVPGCPGLTVDLASPRRLGQGVADAGGRATVSVEIPEAAAGRTILAEAVERSACERSPLVTWPLP